MDNARRAQQRLRDHGYDVAVDGDFGGRSYAALLSYVGDRNTVSQLRSDLGRAAARYFPGVEIITPLRVAHALAQQCVETTRFSTLVESLNYSPAGLRATFSTTRISDAQCLELGRKDGEGALSPERQKAIANLVYGGEWGKAHLGNRQPGDGWLYRGRGAKQLTGRDNYADLNVLLQGDPDVLAHPELVEAPDMGMRAACRYWTRKGCNALADLDAIEKLTLAINGGTNGLDARKKALVRAKVILL